MRFDLFTIRSLGSDTLLSLETNYFLSPENQLVQNHHRFRPEKENLCCFCYFKCFLPCCVWQAIFLSQPNLFILHRAFFSEKAKQQREKFTNWPQILLWPDIRLETQRRWHTCFSHDHAFASVCEKCSVSKEWKRGRKTTRRSRKNNNNCWNMCKSIVISYF